MTEHFHIAIVGSGPSGLSAAAQAAEAGVSHILLEAEAQPASVVRSFQKGKHVMAEPRALPVRSRISFSAGPRERVLETWESELREFDIHFRAHAQVTGIKKISSIFRHHAGLGRDTHRRFRRCWPSACKATSASWACPVQSILWCNTTSTTRMSLSANALP